MVHIILFSAIFLSFLLRKKGKKAQLIPFLILYVFAALRYMYGNDYSSYYIAHALVQTGGRSPFDEFLFVKLNELIPNFFVLIALISYVFLRATYKLVERNQDVLGMCLGFFIFVISPYLFLMNLSAIRQGLAMVMFMWAVEYAIKRKPLQYLLLVLVGAMFHKSAFVLIPVYFFLSPTQFKKRYVVGVLGILVMLLWVVDIQAISNWVAVQFNDANYKVYAQSDMVNSLRATILSSFSFFYVLGNLPKLKNRELVYGKLYLLSTVLGILAIRLSLMTRIQMYFDIFSIVTLPTIFAKVQAEGPIYVNMVNKQETVWRCINKYILPSLIFVVYLLRYYSFFSNPRWQSFATYQTIFSAF